MDTLAKVLIGINNHCINTFIQDPDFITKIRTNFSLSGANSYKICAFLLFFIPKVVLLY